MSTTTYANGASVTIDHHDYGDPRGSDWIALEPNGRVWARGTIVYALTECYGDPFGRLCDGFRGTLGRLPRWDPS